jgi:hypothetical protein
MASHFSAEFLNMFGLIVTVFVHLMYGTRQFQNIKHKEHDSFVVLIDIRLSKSLETSVYQVFVFFESF